MSEMCKLYFIFSQQSIASVTEMMQKIFLSLRFLQFQIMTSAIISTNIFLNDFLRAIDPMCFCDKHVPNPNTHDLQNKDNFLFCACVATL